MRHIDLGNLIAQILTDPIGRKLQGRLVRAHCKAASMKPRKRLKHIERNGTNKWTPVKERMTAVLGPKCWYTEVELIGAPLHIDHYRPVCEYWWLAYDPENFRVSCPYSNSPEHNAEHGCAGGKGDRFPLLAPGKRSRKKSTIARESPVILDPCNPTDCALLAFLPDGRPVLNPHFSGDPIAQKRVDDSKLLLNLDHAAFNAKREQLCREIRDDVSDYEAAPSSPVVRGTISRRLAQRLASTAEFSTAARFYLMLHRHLAWVQAILDAN